MRSYAQGPHPCSRVPCVLLVWRVRRVYSSRALDVLSTSGQRASTSPTEIDVLRHLLIVSGRIIHATLRLAPPASHTLPSLSSHRRRPCSEKGLQLDPYLSDWKLFLHVLSSAAPGSNISQDPCRALWCHNPWMHVRQTQSYLGGQRLSRCTCPGESHPGPVHEDGSLVGRSAPEIDVFEAQVRGPFWFKSFPAE